MHVTDQDAIFRCMCEIELTIARVYQACAVRFPDHAAFWQELASEEEGHAQWLQDLRFAVEEAALQNNPAFPSLDKLTTYLQHVQQRLAECEAGSLNLKHALSIALALEDSMIESAFYTVVAETSTLMSRVYEMLEKQTMDHRNRIAELLKTV
ncbi:MAG: ferritin family protein [Armatimonadota bacterium]